MNQKRKRAKQKIVHRLPRVAILLESTHEMSRGLLRGIARYVRLFGPWGLHVIMGGENDQRLPEVDRWKATGIIAKIHNEQTARTILAADLPTVLFDPMDGFLAHGHPFSALSRVCCDNREIGRLAAEHLLEQGFESFAFIPEIRRTIWSRERLETFRERLGRENKTVAVYDVPPENEQDWGLEFQRVIRWLRKLPVPTAVFTSHDLRARQILDACLIADIKVPGEIAVLGVGNDELVYEVTTPSLSSIAVDTEAGGFAAANMLEGLMRGTFPSRQEFLYPPRGVVPRASTERVAFKDPIVLRAREFIRINSGLSIRVSDVVRHVKASKRSLELRFKETLGRSVLAEIQRVRLETIRRLVADTDTPFGRIAELTGLNSVAYLGEIFKQEFGMTMSEYRDLKTVQK